MTTETVRLDALVRRLRAHALPDPLDEREVLHAPLLTEAADEINKLRTNNVKLLLDLRADALSMKDDPRKGDMVFRCGVNGTIDCVVSSIDELLTKLTPNV